MCIAGHFGQENINLFRERYMRQISFCYAGYFRGYRLFSRSGLGLWHQRQGEASQAPWEANRDQNLVNHVI